MGVVVIEWAGYIGSHNVLEVIKKRYYITVFDDLATDFNENVELTHESTLSISDLSKLFKRNRYDAVVHSTASKAVGESMLESAIYAQNNIIGMVF